MPIYEYMPKGTGCETCRSGIERLQKLSDPPLTACPDCGTPVERVLNAPSVVAGEAHREVADPHGLQRIQQILQLEGRFAVGTIAGTVESGSVGMRREFGSFGRGLHRASWCGSPPGYLAAVKEPDEARQEHRATRSAQPRRSSSPLETQNSPKKTPADAENAQNRIRFRSRQNKKFPRLWGIKAAVSPHC